MGKYSQEELDKFAAVIAGPDSEAVPPKSTPLMDSGQLSIPSPVDLQMPASPPAFLPSGDRLAPGMPNPLDLFGQIPQAIETSINNFLTPDYVQAGEAAPIIPKPSKDMMDVEIDMGQSWNLGVAQAQNSFGQGMFTLGEAMDSETLKKLGIMNMKNVERQVAQGKLPGWYGSGKMDAVFGLDKPTVVTKDDEAAARNVLNGMGLPGTLFTAADYAGFEAPKKTLAYTMKAGQDMLAAIEAAPEGALAEVMKKDVIPSSSSTAISLGATALTLKAGAPLWAATGVGALATFPSFAGEFFFDKEAEKIWPDDKERANLSIGLGVVKAGIEQLSVAGLLPGNKAKQVLQNKAIDHLAKIGSKEFLGNVGKAFSGALMASGGEGLEELGQWGTDVLGKIWGEENYTPNLQDAKRQTLGGVVGGAAFGAGQFGYQAGEMALDVAAHNAKVEKIQGIMDAIDKRNKVIAPLIQQMSEMAQTAEQLRGYRDNKKEFEASLVKELERVNEMKAKQMFTETDAGQKVAMVHIPTYDYEGQEVNLVVEPNGSRRYEITYSPKPGVTLTDSYPVGTVEGLLFGDLGGDVEYWAKTSPMGTHNYRNAFMDVSQVPTKLGGRPMQMSDVDMSKILFASDNLKTTTRATEMPEASASTMGLGGKAYRIENPETIDSVLQTFTDFPSVFTSVAGIEADGSLVHKVQTVGEFVQEMKKTGQKTAVSAGQYWPMLVGLQKAEVSKTWLYNKWKELQEQKQTMEEQGQAVPEELQAELDEAEYGYLTMKNTFVKEKAQLDEATAFEDMMRDMTEELGKILPKGWKLVVLPEPNFTNKGHTGQFTALVEPDGSGTFVLEVSLPRDTDDITTYPQRLSTFKHEQTHLIGTMIRETFDDEFRQLINTNLRMAWEDAMMNSRTLGDFSRKVHPGDSWQNYGHHFDLLLGKAGLTENTATVPGLMKIQQLRKRMEEKLYYFERQLGLTDSMSDPSVSPMMQRDPDILAMSQGWRIPAYHGSLSDFSVFKPGPDDIGMHFGSTPDQANDILKRQLLKDGQVVYPVRLKIENPLIVPDMGSNWLQGMARYVLESGQFKMELNGFSEADVYAQLEKLYLAYELEPTPAITARLRDALQMILEANGYDALVYENQAEGEGRERVYNRVRTQGWEPRGELDNISYVVWDSAQVKGEFNKNPTNHPDIMKAGMADVKPISLIGDEDVEFYEKLVDPREKTKYAMTVRREMKSWLSTLYWYFSAPEYFADMGAGDMLMSEVGRGKIVDMLKEHMSPSQWEKQAPKLEKMFEMYRKIPEVMRLPAGFEALMGKIDRDSQVQALEDSWADKQRQMGEFITRHAVDVMKLGDDPEVRRALYLATQSLEGYLKAEEQGFVRDPEAPLEMVMDSVKGDKNAPSYGALQALNVDMNKIKRKVLTILQAARRNPMIPGLSKPTRNGGISFVEALFRQQREENEKIAEVKDIIDLLSNASPKNQTAIIDLMNELQRYSLDHKKRIHWSELPEFAQQHDIAINDFVVKTVMMLDARLQGMIREFVDMRKMEVTRTIKPGPEQSQRLLELDQGLEDFLSQHYFPWQRFGDWKVSVTATQEVVGEGDEALVLPSKDVLIAEHYESEADALEAAKRMAREYGLGDSNPAIVVEKVPQDVRMYSGLPPMFVRDLRELAVTEGQRAAIDSLISKTAPGEGYLRNLRKKRGIEGYTKDGIRALASYGMAYAKHYARSKYAGSVREAIGEVEQLIRDVKQVPGNWDVRNLQELAEMMRGVVAWKEDPNKGSNMLASAAFHWHLTGSPRAAFLQLMQIPTVVLPHIAKKYGMQGAWKLLNESYKDVMKFNYSDELKRAVNLAVNEGVLDNTMVHEVLRHDIQRMDTNRSRKGKVKDTLQDAWDKYSQLLAAPFQTLGAWTRRVAFVTAWKAEMEVLKKDRELSPQQREVKAYEAARKVTYDTNWGYEVWNRPEFMRGDIGSVMFIFFTHMQHYLEFVTGGKTMPGSLGALAMLALIAGLEGLPGAEDGEEIATFLFRQANKLAGKEVFPSNARVAVREILKQQMDKTVGDPDGVITDLVLRGAGAYGLGLPTLAEKAGVPLAYFDIHNSLSLGKVIPGMDMLNAKDPEAAISRGVADLAGPGAAVPLAVMKGMYDNSGDVQKQLALALPSYLRNPFLAYQYSQEMKVTDAKGGLVADLDPNNPYHMSEIVLQGMGFQPTRFSTTKLQRFSAMEEEMYYQARRRMIFQHYYQSMLQQDTDRQLELKEEIKAYNKSVPYPALRISGKQLVQNMKDRFESAAKTSRDLPQDKKAAAIYKKMEEIFPSIKYDPTGKEGSPYVEEDLPKGH